MFEHLVGQKSMITGWNCYNFNSY